MTNKYLEKIALNAFEKHLSKQPPDKAYSDPKVQKAHGLVQKSKEALKTGAFAKEFGGSASSVQKYKDMARIMLRRQRGILRV